MIPVYFYSAQPIARDQPLGLPRSPNRFSFESQPAIVAYGSNLHGPETRNAAILHEPSVVHRLPAEKYIVLINCSTSKYLFSVRSAHIYRIPGLAEKREQQDRMRERESSASINQTTSGVERM